MEKREQLYSGKAKDVYATDDPALCILAYRDDATALNGQKTGSFTDKGVVNNAISAILFQRIAEAGVPTHFVAKLNERETLAKRVRILPLEVIVRNIAAGSFAQRYGLAEGVPLRQAVQEYCLKKDELNDPPIAHSSILALELASEEQLLQIERYAAIINSVLGRFFSERGLRLIDFKVEFGLTAEGDLVLADEISPDSCRLWDAQTGEKMDKDRFRRDLGGFAEAYREVLHRLEA